MAALDERISSYWKYFPSTSLSIFFTILDFELISQTLNFIIIIKHWSVGLESYVEINSFPYEIGEANLYFFVVV